MIPRAGSPTRALFMFFLYFYKHGLCLHPAPIFQIGAGANVLWQCLSGFSRHFCHLHPACAGLQSLQVLRESHTYPSLYCIDGRTSDRTISVNRVMLPLRMKTRNFPLFFCTVQLTFHNLPKSIAIFFCSASVNDCVFMW